MNQSTEKEDCDALNLSSEDIFQLQSIVHHVVDTDGKDAHTSYSKFSHIITQYQEQPQLLDSILESLVSPLAHLLLSLSDQDTSSQPPQTALSEENMKRFQSISKLLWQLSSVRGYKTILRFFPNEVPAFEPAADLLTFFFSHRKETKTSSSFWEAEYVLLMWLSLLALVPFDIAVVDSSLSDTTTTALDAHPIPPLAHRIITICKEYLSSPGSTREMAAVMLGRLLTRPDMVHGALAPYVEWACWYLQETDTNDAITSTATTAGVTGASNHSASPISSFLIPGVLLSLATIFKFGKRESLTAAAVLAVPQGHAILSSQQSQTNALVRKLSIKLVQRAGLVFLPQRPALWRYAKGRTSPLSARSGANPNGDTQHGHGTDDDSKDIYTDNWMHDRAMAEAVETSIECMLSALSDRDTIVRWSAAKGLGRITERLPRSFANDVVDSLLHLFHDDAPLSDGGWQGGCLALAELTRRGLLLPERLTDVVPLVVKALEYDVRKGHCSVGSHVRDAAAYVCWAIARAYDPSLLGEVVTVIAPALITLACFDREVNCRRAAAAAFQESVGRLGSFPYGIDIVTAADFFSVSQRTQAYVPVASFVAKFPGYFDHMAWHLLRVKMHHWEKSLRELTGKALAALVHVRPTFFIETGMDHVLMLCTSPVLESRHGAVAAVAEMLLALKDSRGTVENESSRWLPEQLEQEVADLVHRIRAKNLHKGKGGEIMRSALCRLIETTSKTGIELTIDQTISVYEMIFENLQHPSSEMQHAAAVALAAFVSQYCHMAPAGSLDTTGGPMHADEVVQRLLHDLESRHSVDASRGAALALGLLPGWALEGRCSAALSCLARSASGERDGERGHIDIRVNAVCSLGRVTSSLWGPDGVDPGACTESSTVRQEIVSLVLLPLLRAMDDYSTDNRGDIGRWVREAAMNALHAVFAVLGAPAIGQYDEFAEAADITLSLFLRQASERIGRVREIAGSCLQSIVPIFTQGNIAPAKEVSKRIASLTLEEYATGHALPALARFIPIESLSVSMLEGFAYSIGGLDAQLRDAATEAMVDALIECIERYEEATEEKDGNGDGANDSARKEQLQGVSSAFVIAWSKHTKSPRMSIPFLATAEIILSRTNLHEYAKDGFLLDVYAATCNAMKGCGDIPRLHAASAVLCQLVLNAGGKLQRDALASVVGMIGSRYPKVRRYTAEQLYTALLAWDEDKVDDGDGKTIDIYRTMQLLSDTPWDGSPEIVRPARMELFDALGLQI